VFNPEEERHSNWWAKYIVDFSDAAFAIRNLEMKDPSQIEFDVITVKWSRKDAVFESDPLIGCVEVKLANRNAHNQAATLIDQLKKRYRRRCFNFLTGMMDEASGIDWTAFPAWSGFIEAKKPDATGRAGANVKRPPESLFVSYGKERAGLLWLVRQFYQTALGIKQKVVFVKCQLQACAYYYGFGLGEAPPIGPEFLTRHSVFCKEAQGLGKKYEYLHRETQIGSQVFVSQRNFRWL
jgi:hypothetical protein